MQKQENKIFVLHETLSEIIKQKHEKTENLVLHNCLKKQSQFLHIGASQLLTEETQSTVFTLKKLLIHEQTNTSKKPCPEQSYYWPRQYVIRKSKLWSPASQGTHTCLLGNSGNLTGTRHLARI